MEIDLNFLFAFFVGVLLVTFSAFYILLKFKSVSEGQSEFSKNSKTRKKKKTVQPSGVSTEDLPAVEKVAQLISKASFSFEQIRGTVGVLLQKIPKEKWGEVLPRGSEFDLRLVEKDSIISKMKIEVSSLLARLENAQDELNFCSKTSKGVEDSFKGRINSLEAEIKRIQESVEESSSKHAAVESELKRRLSNAKQSEGEALDCVSRLREEKTELIKRVKDAESYNGHEVAAEKNKLIGVIQEEITATNRRLVVANNTVESLKRQLSATDDSAQMNEQLAEKLSLTETKVTQLTGAVAELTNEKQRVEAALEERTKALSSTRQMMTKLSEGQGSSEFDRLTRECELLKVRLAEAQSEMARLRGEDMNGTSIMDGLTTSGL